MENVSVIHEMPGCKVVKNADATVTKFGPRVSLSEASSLKFAHDLGLPVPRVHAAQKDGHITSITMDFVDGVSLDHAWPIMSTPEKHRVMSQLRSILDTMASAKPPEFFIGSCDGGPAWDCRSISAYSGGPYQRESEFNAFVLDLAGPPPVALANAFGRRLPTESRIVLAHGDLAQHNILVQNANITGIIDWEYAGWYPEYWDYVKFFQRYASARDWKDSASAIFSVSYEDILLDYQAIYRWQKT